MKDELIKKEELQGLGFYEDVEPENYEQKCPVVFVVDRSGSMGYEIDGKVPIDELNEGLKVFEKESQKDEVCSSRLDIAIVSFGSDVKVERDFGLLEEGPMPEIKISGSTRADLGIRKGLELIKKRKDWYDASGQTRYRPYLIYIGDGGADDSNKIDPIATELKELGANKSLNFWPIAVQGAAMPLLEKLAMPQYDGSLAPMKLDGLNFVKLFEWLSSSFTKISNSREGEAIDISPEVGKNPFQFTV